MFNGRYLICVLLSLIPKVHCQTCTAANEWAGDDLAFESTFNCYGYQCCANTTISPSNRGNCNGARGCIYGDVQTNDVLSCGGYLGCAFSSHIDSYVFFFSFPRTTLPADYSFSSWCLFL